MGSWSLLMSMCSKHHNIFSGTNRNDVSSLDRWVYISERWLLVKRSSFPRHLSGSHFSSHVWSEVSDHMKNAIGLEGMSHLSCLSEIKCTFS